MSDLHVRYLLIGGGVASGAAAEAIRQIDRIGSILLVAQEINRPYYRRLLGTDYLLGRMEHEALFMQPAAWYDQQEIELHTGRAASHLDASRQVVTLDNGEEISFDRLLIATGSSPERLRISGADLPNVYYLRSIEEAERLRHAASKSLHEGRGRATVIGGGLFGVELAATLRQMHLEVDLVCEEAHPWAALAGENLGGLVGRVLSSRGIKTHVHAHPVKLEGDGRVQRVLLDKGEMIATDLVIGAVGIAPNKQILRGTPIRSETAILVDAHGRTNVPEIFAAGECAAIFDPLFGKHRLLQHESSALETGRLAGRNMAGVEESYSAVNFFGSEIFNLEMVGWGETRLIDHRIVRGKAREDDPDLLEIGVDNAGRIVQVAAVGKAVDRDVLPELVRRGVRVDGHEEMIKDPAFDLRMLVG
jgi:3-phenylpropionate/trans-cinnamate dioxygenase ferredoxin reductase subunit